VYKSHFAGFMMYRIQNRIRCSLRACTSLAAFWVEWRCLSTGTQRRTGREGQFGVPERGWTVSWSHRRSSWPSRPYRLTRR